MLDRRGIRGWCLFVDGQLVPASKATPVWRSLIDNKYALMIRSMFHISRVVAHTSAEQSYAAVDNVQGTCKVFHGIHESYDVQQN